MALLISRCEPGKRERRFPMGASLCFAESAMQYLLPPAHLGRHLRGAAGAPRSPFLCQESRPLTGPDARPPGCAQRLPGHVFPRQAKRQHCDLRSLWRRLKQPTHAPNCTGPAALLGEPVPLPGPAGRSHPGHTLPVAAARGRCAPGCAPIPLSLAPGRRLARSRLVSPTYTVLPCSVALVQASIEVKGRANNAYVRKRLREVPQCFATGANFFGVEAEMVGIGEHFFKNIPCLLQVASPREGLHQPESAHVKRAFRSGQPITGPLADLVAMHQTV